MRKLMRRLAAGMVCGLGLAANAFGQQAGDEVVVVTKEAQLKREATVVKTTYRGNYLTVREVNGPWLWVDSDGTRGWLSRNQVILASRALDYFTDELQRNPKDARALIARAIAWHNKGELANAIGDCTDAISINSEDAWAYKIRGNAWEAKQEYDLAISDYNEGIRHAPTDNGFYCNRGLCHHAKKNYEKAIADLTEAIRRNPKSSRNFEYRGNSYSEKKEYDKALADYTMASELDPKADGAYFGRASVHEKRGTFTKALAEYEAALRTLPNSAHAHNALAWFLATCPNDQARDGRRAVEVAKKAVDLEADELKKAWFQDTLAAAFAEVGNFEEAAKLQARAMIGASKEELPEFEARLKLYQSGQPYRDVPQTEVATTTAAK